jgi:hypothetical protein
MQHIPVLSPQSPPVPESVRVFTGCGLHAVSLNYPAFSLQDVLIP